jgi:hypothetical protein
VESRDNPVDGYALLTLCRSSHRLGLTEEQNKNNVPGMFTWSGRRTMLKIFIEEAAALTSIALFIGMVAVWAQVLPQL